ncbi:hypothetical protein HDF16_002153 [Granulicella aggregans]|uniref:Uncharacterized protein n=1 Tax=Granulicella aggregans TaxID=474949 RepID=A0A7W7ZCV5_9BACT|nr:hypothetical protein [Granulicella aggregans]
MLGYSSQDVNRQAIGLREVAGNEIDSSLHQRRDKVDVASKTIELGDDECCPMESTETQGFGNGGPVVPLSAFNFHDLSDKRPIPPG